MTTHVDTEPRVDERPVLAARAGEWPGATTLGRFVFALPFAVFGVLHFLNASAMAPAVPIPGGEFWVYFTGAAFLAGSLGMVTGVLGKWAAYGIALLMLVFIVTIHIPGLSNPELRQTALSALLKDTALMGGALTWAGLFASRSPREPALRTRRSL